MQSCVRSGPDIVSKVESDMGSLRHILTADSITPRTHQRLRLLLNEDLPELIRETRELRGTIGRQYLANVDYEYAVQMSHGDGREPFTLPQYFPQREAAGEYWGEQGERRRNLGWLRETFPNTEFWMVKRRKAGKAERA